MLHKCLFLLLVICSIGWTYRLTIGTPHVLTIPSYFPKPIDSLSLQLTDEAIELGRYLFYDSILSLDQNLACATCHQQAFAFSEGPFRVNQHTTNAPRERNTPPLFNLAWAKSLFWDGRSKSLMDQVLEVVPSHHEMQLNWKLAVKRIQGSSFYRKQFKSAYGKQRIDSSLIANAIVQFEITLISTNSKYDRVLQGLEYLTQDEYQGFVLMNEQTKGDCMHCHTTDGDPLGTTHKMSNNGLDRDELLLSSIDQGKFHVSGNIRDRGYFKIPSVRNLLFTAPYMHDGRFNTLEEVLTFYSSGVNTGAYTDFKMQHARKGGVQLSEKEQQQIISFLKTLSDSTFITNPSFRNPFYP